MARTEPESLGTFGEAAFKEDPELYRLAGKRRPSIRCGRCHREIRFTTADEISLGLRPGDQTMFARGRLVSAEEGSPSTAGADWPEGFFTQRVKLWCRNDRCRRNRSPWVLTVAELQRRVIRAFRAGSRIVYLDD